MPGTSLGTEVRTVPKTYNHVPGAHTFYQGHTIHKINQLYSTVGFEKQTAMQF